MSITNNQLYRGWFRRRFTGLREKIRSIEKDFAKVRDERVLARQQELHPKKKKNFPILPEEEFDKIVSQLRDEWLPMAQPIMDVLNKVRDLKESRLNALATSVEIITEECMHLVRTCPTDVYRSQTQPHFYAKNSLVPYEAALKKRGVETHIKYVSRWRTEGGRGPFGYMPPSEGGDYQLWANIPDWMCDAVARTVTIEEALEALPRTCNAKVIMPMLDYERFDKHMMGGYQKKEEPCSSSSETSSPASS